MAYLFCTDRRLEGFGGNSDSDEIGAEIRYDSGASANNR